MKTSTPVAFAFEDSAVRIIPDAEKPLFVAKDVAAALGYEKPRNAIQTHCKGALKRGPLETEGGAQEMILIEEPDVYRLIFGSKLESAKRFQDWVFEEVLPAIRKSGGYGVLSPSDEIRYLNQRLALLKELMRVREPLLREKIYEQFKTVSDRLGYDTPVLSEFAPPGNETVKDDAVRQVLEDFWAAVDGLQAKGILLNHQRDPALLALNLKEVREQARAHGYPMPDRIALLRALPESVQPRFVESSVTVSSAYLRNRRGDSLSVRCHIFRKSA